MLILRKLLFEKKNLKQYYYGFFLNVCVNTFVPKIWMYFLFWSLYTVVSDKGWHSKANIYRFSISIIVLSWFQHNNSGNRADGQLV